MVKGDIRIQFHTKLGLISYCNHLTEVACYLYI
jgi:hypothetical protein